MPYKYRLSEVMFNTFFVICEKSKEGAVFSLYNFATCVK